ncbi:hypothetical protein [Desmospora profundinema]|uniref:Uncharacterized protein n=1 Tax=Desmospora profundinema TaxID=1571184 RepID=A0ABU1INL9_9BACL|nr:hypothetical protein [Desmospora profundinema]MDR6226380.1 hypothetical protein [Desmospora profundinema]
MRIFLTILITCMVLYVIFLAWSLVEKFNQAEGHPMGTSPIFGLVSAPTEPHTTRSPITL